MGEYEGVNCTLLTDGSAEAQRIEEALEKAKIAFEIVKEPGKVLPELVVGDPTCRDSWLTGEDAVKKWIKEIKKSKRQG